MNILLSIQQYEPIQEYWLYNDKFQINHYEGIAYGFMSFLLLTVAVLVLKYKKDNDNLAKQNTRLIADNAVHEVEVLKEKLKPHALKNTLAYMKASITGLNKSIESLSEILDYILYGTKGHLVCPKDELAFLNNLLDFHSIRLEQISINPIIEVDEHSAFYEIPCIPHLVSAYFIENALEHGDIKASDFLQVNVRLSGSEFSISVKNKMKTTKKEVVLNEKGGIGLDNLEKRLNLLSTKHNVSTGVENGYFLADLKIKLHD